MADVLNHITSDERPSVLLGYVEGLHDGRAFGGRRPRRAQRRERRCAAESGRDPRRPASRRVPQRRNGRQRRGVGGGIPPRRSAHCPQPSRPSRRRLRLAGPHRPAGARLGIVSMSGGAGTLMADRAAQLSLAVPEFGLDTRVRLAEALPGFAAPGHPVDYGDPEAIVAAVRAVAEAPEIGITAMSAGLSPGLAGVIEEPLARIAQATGKPLVVAWLGGPAEGLHTLRALGVPAYEDPIRAVEVAAGARLRAAVAGRSGAP